MKEANRIIQEIREVEEHLEQLKIELSRIQAACEHTYDWNSLVSTCAKCKKIESNYY